MEAPAMKSGPYWGLPAPSMTYLGEPEGQQAHENHYFIRSSLCDELPQGELVGMSFARERVLSETSGVTSTLRLIIKVGDVVFHVPARVHLVGVVPPSEEVAHAEPDTSSLSEEEVQLLNGITLLRDQVEATATALPRGELVWADVIEKELHVVAQAPGGVVVHAQRPLDSETPFKVGFQATAPE